MGKIIVFTNVTLDGVMQGPARPDEDQRSGFKYGGWAVPYAAMSSDEARENMGNNGALLVGRRTYEDLYDFWPKQTDGNPFTEMLNKMPKYVVSTTLKEPLPWVNSTLINGDVAKALTKLKQAQEKDIMVMGSGKLIQSMMKDNLVDLYILLIHPLVLGMGQKLFAEDGATATLELVDSKPTSKGVVVATYKPAEAKAEKSG
nr:dihydrofolate reductase [uncultured bacterium]